MAITVWQERAEVAVMLWDQIMLEERPIEILEQLGEGRAEQRQAVLEMVEPLIESHKYAVEFGGYDDSMDFDFTPKFLDFWLYSKVKDAKQIAYLVTRPKPYFVRACLNVVTSSDGKFVEETTDDKAAFFGVYRKKADGTSQAVADVANRQAAELVADLLNESHLKLHTIGGA